MQRAAWCIVTVQMMWSRMVFCRSRKTLIFEADSPVSAKSLWHTNPARNTCLQVHYGTVIAESR